MSGMIELTAYSGKFLGPIAKVLGWIMSGIYDIVLKISGGTLEIIGIILQFQLVVLADASLFPKHGLEGAVNLLTGVFGHPFEYIFS